jgi:hypothetical protein
MSSGKKKSSGDQAVYEQVMRGMHDAGFSQAVEKLTITSSRAELHEGILFGDGRNGLVHDVESLKLNTQNTLNDINATLAQLKSQIAPLLEWKAGIVTKVAVIIAFASTVSAILGAIFAVLVNWQSLYNTILQVPK